ncbi:unnamed protein product [Closterium sp. Naga37s-1]|nr:unnamed protein product [Closterium sp. Naga37s-1]
MATSSSISRAVLTRAVPVAASRISFCRVHSHSLAQLAAPERAASKRSRQWQIHATRAESRQDSASSPVSPSSAETAKIDLKVRPSCFSHCPFSLILALPRPLPSPVPSLLSVTPRSAFATAGCGAGSGGSADRIVGRASLLGEAVTGQGILAQLNLETGIPVYEAEPLLLFFVLFNMLGAVGALGDRGKFVLEPVKPPVPPANAGWKGALGLVENGGWSGRV